MAFLAARHPGRVRALVLGEPPVLPLLENTSEGKTLRNDFLATVWEPAGDLMQRGHPRRGIQHFVDGVVETGAFDRFPTEVQTVLMDNACEFKAETSSPEFWTPFRSAEAEQIAAPTLLLTCVLHAVC
jgi:non-heme chloroperoxidase